MAILYNVPSKIVAKRLVDCLFAKELIEENPDAYMFEVNYSIPEGQDPRFTIFTGSYFLDQVFTRYANRLILTDEENPAGYVYDLFYNWRITRNRAYAKMAFAIDQNYNPIENYEMREVMTNDITTHARDSSDTHETTPYTSETTTTTHSKKTEEITPFTEDRTTTTYPTKTEETTPYTSETTTTGSDTPNTPTNTTTNGKMAFNSNAWSNTDKSETTENRKEVLTKAGKEKIETSYDESETVVVTKQGKEKTETTYDAPETVQLIKAGKETTEITYAGTNTDTRNYTLTRTGNTGTQTAADMIKKEYDNLMINLADQAISEFIDMYTFYAEGVC